MTIDFPIPAGITIATPKPTEIVISGIDKQRVGQVGRGDPRLPRPRALQGQGRQVCRRIHLPQGRQEEVRTAMAMTKHAKDVRTRRARASRDPRRQRRTVVPRLSVFRSSKQIYAQVIDDANGDTLVAASSLEKAHAWQSEDRRDRRGGEGGRQADRRARQAGVKDVVFDRGGYLYPRPRQGAGRGGARGRAEF